MRTSISGTSTKIIIPGCAIPNPYPFATAIIRRCGAIICRGDYRSDCARFRIVKTVHMEAEWDRADPVAETRWIETIAREHGLPSACIGHAEPGRPDIEEVLAGHAKSALVRGIRHKP